ncbi:hypothetical protein VTI28DRAFT_6367 [Corynascus sepedonium]
MRDSESPPPNLDKGKSIETTGAAADISSDKPPASTGPRRDPNPSTPLQSTPSPTRKLPDGDDRRQQDSSSAILAAEPDEVHDEDEFVLTDGYDTASTGSTSVTSSVYAHSIENGRRYQHFKNGRYPIPNDDEELNREDMKHAMLLELCDGALYYAPIGDNVQKILDIGTGTGIWAIEMGDRFPSARVRGIDLSPTQPAWVPPNVDFLVDDCEQDEWLDRDVDFVHLRFMIIVLRDVPRVLSHAYESLKPGGWIELQELCAEILCDDGSMPDDDPVKYMYELGRRAFEKFGMNVTLPKNLEPMLRDAGFQNIQCVVKKVPIGPWARDKTLRLIGQYQKMAVQEIMPVLPGRPFTALGMSQVESQVTLAHARQGLDDMRVHRYFHYYFWFAQKP